MGGKLKLLRHFPWGLVLWRGVFHQLEFSERRVVSLPISLSTRFGFEITDFSSVDVRLWLCMFPVEIENIAQFYCILYVFSTVNTNKYPEPPSSKFLLNSPGSNSMQKWDFGRIRSIDKRLLLLALPDPYLRQWKGNHYMFSERCRGFGVKMF